MDNPTGVIIGGRIHLGVQQEREQVQRRVPQYSGEGAVSGFWGQFNEFLDKANYFINLISMNQ